MLVPGKAEVPSDRPPASKSIAPSRGNFVRRLAIYLLLLGVTFSLPLFQWAKFALNSDLFSYTLLIPFISGYFAWIHRQKISASPGLHFRPALIPAIAAGLLLATFFLVVGTAPPLIPYLAAMILAFVLLVAAGCIAFLGVSSARQLAFPLGFLLFMIPFPDFLRNGIEAFLQHASAEAAFAMLKLSGMPVFRQDLVFQLPGFSMHVAPECSGIRSSLILFITSIIAAQLFLKRPLFKMVLVTAVVVLGILRNGFRIFVLGQLCVRINPNMIDSDLHHRGGPIFFALSLVPLFLLLWFLRKRERKMLPPGPDPHS